MFSSVSEMTTLLMMLLTVHTDVGFSLRKDNPVALKEFIQKVQQKCQSVDMSHFRDK